MSYQLDPWAAARAREDARVRGEAAALGHRARALVAAAQAARDRYGESVELPHSLTDVDTAGNAAGVQRKLGERRRELEIAEARLAEQTDSARQRQLLSVISGPSIPVPPPPPQPAAPRRRAASAAAIQHEPPEVDAAAKATEIVKRLLPAVTARTAVAIERAASAIAQERSPSRRAAALDDLRVRVQLANEEVAARDVRRRQIEEWRRRLAGLPGVQEALRLLDEHEDGAGALPRDVLAVLEAAATDGERRLDDAYVAETIADAFADLGYEVSQGFQTLLTENGFADVSNARWRGYAVRVRARAPGGEEGLRFNVVRAASAPASSLRDTEVETAWCSDFPPLLDRLRDSGVQARIASQVPPGTHPVQVVRGEPETAETRRTTARTLERGPRAPPNAEGR